MNSNDKIGDLELRLKMLQDENKALLKLASHDIRSPLNKLFALLNLLKMADEAPTEEQLGYIEKMELVLSDGLHRMRNLSELYAIENDSIKDLSENVELQSLISRNLRDQKINAERKSISFKFISEPVTTQTDRLSVQRIFDQLISNAIKFTPTGKAIEVGLKMEESIVSISITDGGYGIREEEQKLLFQKFKVLSTPTTGGESKTGLGLFIAQWNAKNIGGKIIYENIGGSTFRIELPLIQLA
mgnify:CR=1 FL=1